MVELSQLVNDMADRLRLSAGPCARLEFHLDLELPLVAAGPDPLRQVLSDTVQQAALTCGRRDSVITLTTRMLEVDPAWLAEGGSSGALPPGAYVCVEISSNGPGPDAAGPLPPPAGSAGFAAVPDLLRSWRGALHVSVNPDGGSRYTLLFVPHRETAPEAAPAATSRNWRGSGTVLIVDDEAAVRATTAQMVAYFGFAVQAVGSGQQALDLLSDPERRFDLVLLDLTMPGMDGFATFTAIRQLRPDQRIVVFSGYSEQDARQRFSGGNLNGFLQKPFSADALREVLAQSEKD